MILIFTQLLVDFFLPITTRGCCYIHFWIHKYSALPVEYTQPRTIYLDTCLQILRRNIARRVSAKIFCIWSVQNKCGANFLRAPLTCEIFLSATPNFQPLFGVWQKKIVNFKFIWGAKDFCCGAKSCRDSSISVLFKPWAVLLLLLICCWY